MTVVNLDDLRRHRTVQENFPAPELPVVPVPCEPVQQFLAATDGEGRDQHVAAVAPGLREDVAEFGDRFGAVAMQPAAIGRFHQHQVGARRRIGIAQDRRIERADIAGKNQRTRGAVLVGLQRHGGRAEDMAGIAQGQAQPRQDLAGLAIRQRAHQSHHRTDVAAGEQRLVMGVAAATMLVVALGIHLGQRGGVFEHDAQQVGGGFLRVDGPTKPAFHQHREPAAMVDMRVTQHHRVERGGVETESFGIARLVGLAALDHAAVQQQPVARREHLVAGTGDFAGRTMEDNPHRPLPSVPPDPADI